LAAIAGYAEMLLDHPPDAPQSRQIVERISRLAFGLCEISSALLLSRGGASRRQSRRRFAVRALLEDCARAVEPQCRDKGLALRLELPDAGEFRGDAVAVTRIVQNLLSNAVRYTQRGEVRLRARFELGGLL